MTPFFSFLLGACIGSFLNVCLVRWKNGGQIFTPPSFCPQCKKSIKWFDNIPIFSFFMLGGRCRSCRKPISRQYPIIEASTALLFGFSSEKFSKESTLLLFSFVFASFLVLLMASDLKWRLLPHPFNNFFILGGFTFCAFRSGHLNLFDGANSFVIMGSAMFGMMQFFAKGLGGGDVKMISGLAVWLGVMKTLYVLVFACVTASLLFFALLVMKRVSWKWMIPFGPFLALGAFGVWFFPGLFERVRMVL